MTERQIDLAAIETRANAATRGPWGWRGHRETQSISLDARHRKYGSCEVMTFWRWGMQRAKPVFANHETCTLLPDTENRLIYQVCPEATSHTDPRVYRQTIIGIRHPDAEFIAHARQDVDDLLATVRSLQDRIRELEVLA